MAIELKVLQKSLPNFPSEVLEEWLLPYAISEGWPPALTELDIPSGRWRYLLSNRSLSYWRSITWRKYERHVSINELHPDYINIMTQMVLGAVEGQRNLYSTSIPDLTTRFNRIKEYFSQYGTFPKPPVLLAEQEGFTIADGNHRMAAYFYCYGYFKLDLDDALQLKTNELQPYWIGEI